MTKDIRKTVSTVNLREERTVPTSDSSVLIPQHSMSAQFTEDLLRIQNHFSNGKSMPFSATPSHNHTATVENTSMQEQRQRIPNTTSLREFKEALNKIGQEKESAKDGQNIGPPHNLCSYPGCEKGFTKIDDLYRHIQSEGHFFGEKPGGIYSSTLSTPTMQVFEKQSRTNPKKGTVCRQPGCDPLYEDLNHFRCHLYSANRQDHSGPPKPATFYTQPFCDFLTKNPTIFHTVDYFARELEHEGYKQLSERESWELKKGGKYYVERNGSSMIAFSIGDDYKTGNGAAMVAGHIDALTAKLKPIPKLNTKAGYVQLGVAPYAGALNSTWWDRDLSIGGRVLVKESSGKIVSKLVKLDWPSEFFGPKMCDQRI
jgi:hypothetical protein